MCKRIPTSVGIWVNGYAVLALVGCSGGGGHPPPPSDLSYPSPVTAIVGTAFTSLSPTVVGTVTNYVVSPALPSGLVLDSATGVISGTPTATADQATYTISARNAYGNTTFGLVLTAGNPVPTLSSVSPNSVASGSPDFAITLQGTGFVATSSVLWNAASQLATSVTPVQLTTTVHASDLMTLGDIALSVQNPGPGGGTSTPLLVHVGGPLRASPTGDGSSADGGSFL